MVKKFTDRWYELFKDWLDKSPHHDDFPTQAQYELAKKRDIYERRMMVYEAYRWKNFIRSSNLWK